MNFSQMRFYKKGTRYIQVLQKNDTTAKVLAVDLPSEDFLSDYRIITVMAKWALWEKIDCQEFFAAVARFAEIEAELG